MSAAKKMVAAGLKSLSHKTGADLVTVYRWKKAIEDGRGVRDAVKQRLIDATADTPEPIEWGDFIPAEVG